MRFGPCTWLPRLTWLCATVCYAVLCASPFQRPVDELHVLPGHAQRRQPRGGGGCRSSVGLYCEACGLKWWQQLYRPFAGSNYRMQVPRLSLLDVWLPRSVGDDHESGRKKHSAYDTSSCTVQSTSLALLPANRTQFSAVPPLGSPAAQVILRAHHIAIHVHPRALVGGVGYASPELVVVTVGD